ncbi:MAG TPA: DUF4215 domain-containing protein [Polyangiaceae bacterium]|nr:DUF4215 domain-containing protein [Polyangiaceae bacterium]
MALGIGPNALVACGSGDSNVADGAAEASSDATGGPDAPGADSGGMDGTVQDAAGDTAMADTEAPDTGDAGGTDTGATDTGATDTGVIDTGVVDTGTTDTGVIDTGVVDTGVVDTGAADTGAADATVDSNPVCGDGVRDGTEECDDGNLVDLDGCDSTCHFEQETRATNITLQWTTDTFCTHDALLEAIGSAAQSTFQGDIDSAVTAGTLNVLFKYFGITDLTGQSGTTSVGSYNGTVVPYTGSFNGNSDLDWWYTLDTTTAGASPSYTPTAKESVGTFTGGVLSASGGHVWMSAFGTSMLDISAVSLKLPIGTPATTPTVSTGTSPGHLASENLDPALTSFPTGGGSNTTPTGQLCGDVTAASLAATPIPSQLLSYCTNYNSTNSMLDVLVGGCTYSIITIVKATQPDQVNPDATPAGAGGPYTFGLNSTHHVASCKDKNNATVSPYTLCLPPAAYSSYFKIAVDRVILKHP